MNALTHHLRFLRPLRSVLFTAICFTMAESMAKKIPRLDSGAVELSAYFVALPIIVGLFIAGAAHEPLHRPFALLLPGLRLRQLRFAALSLGVAALMATVIAHWMVPTLSPAAALGLILALMALSQLNRHRQGGYASAPAVGFFVWLLLNLAFAQGFANALNRSPIPCLLVGLAFAALSLRFGYSRESCRRRAQTPFVSLQTQLFSHVFSPAVSVRWQAETIAHGLFTAPSVEALGHQRPSRPTGFTTRDWLGVLRRLEFARWRFERYFSPLGLAISTAVICFAFLPALGLASGQPNYLAALVNGADLRVAITMQCIVTVGLFLNFNQPDPLFPISRARRGELVFMHFASAWLFTLLWPIALIFLPSLVGQLLSGHALPGFGLYPLLVGALALAPLLPLAIGANLKPARRPLTIFGLTIVSVLVSLYVRDLAQPYRPEPVGCSIIAILSAASLTWMRRRILRHCRDCDLVTGSVGDPPPARLDASAHTYTVATR